MTCRSGDRCCPGCRGSGPIGSDDLFTKYGAASDAKVDEYRATVIIFSLAHAARAVRDAESISPNAGSNLNTAM